MAITIHQTPQLWTPAYNDQWILALSDEIAQPLFKYKVEVTVYYDLNGTPSNEVFTYYVVPRPDGYLVFNAKEIVKNFVQHFIKPNDFGIVEAVNERVDVSIDISETWTGETGTATENVGYLAWNACLTERKIFLDNYDYEDYISKTTVIKIHSRNNVLPDTVYTLKSDVFVNFVYTEEIKKIAYYVVDTNGVSVLDTYLIFEDGVFAPLVNGLVYQLNISPQLAVDESFTIDNGYYIRLEFLDAADDALESYQYLISEPCTKHEVKRLYYLNRNGGISFQSFELKSTKNISKQTNDVKLNRNEILNGEWKYKPYKHERNVVSTQETFSEVLNTNWITKLQSEYLEELFSSPMVWLVSEEDDYSDPYKFKPVVITDKSYEFKKHENEKLFNYSVLVEYSTTETRQRAI